MLKYQEDGPAGSSFTPRQTEGSFVSIGFDGALIGGFGFQIGLVNDALGDTDFFVNFNGNMGFGLFTGLSAGTVDQLRKEFYLRYLFY